MFAIVRVNGKQYKVEKGSEFIVDRMDAEEGASLSDLEVLLVGGDDDVKIGSPIVDGAKVAATVVRHQKGRKIHVFKYKPKKNYRRRIGSRPHQTLLRVDDISV